MAEGTQRDEWDRAALICAQVTNSQIARQSDLIPPWRFNPFELKDREAAAARPLMIITDPKDLARMMGVKI
jgi:RNA polymerase subunit RPABC4/transcription elongation factor Spt4